MILHQIRSMASLPPERKSPFATCAACSMALDADARFCKGCGQPASPGVQPMPAFDHYVVIEPDGVRIACALAVPPRCPTCKAVGTLKAMYSAVEKLELAKEEKEPAHRIFWKVQAYERLRCAACPADFVVGPSKLRQEWEYPTESKVGFWKGNVRTIRQFRGFCQTCNKAEMNVSCRKCGKHVCAAHASGFHSLCLDCAPKCYVCGRISVRACMRCGKDVCTDDSKFYWFQFRCVPCRDKDKRAGRA